MENNPANQSNIISVDRVFKKYDGEPILKNISFTLPGNGLTIITGPSGSGKSTLMRMLCGIETPDSGDISINGQAINQYSTTARSSFIGGNVGLILQDPLLDRNLTVLENIVLPNQAKNRAIDYGRIATLSILFGLEEDLQKPVTKLSGGQQIRVSLIRALALDNKIILADEPTNHLDTHNKINVLEALKKIVVEQKTSAIIVTHDVELARHVADKEISIKDGVVDSITVPLNYLTV